MHFELLLLDGDDGYIGKHNMLHLLAHYSTSLNSTAAVSAAAHGVAYDPSLDPSRVDYKLPQVKDLRFYRFWDFGPTL